MQMEYKDDLEVAQRRMAAWWEGAIIDRAVVQVTAPRSGVAADHLDSLRSTDGLSRDRLLAWYTDPELVIPRHERLVAGTFWGGEAVPVMFPFSISLVAIVAAYLGCPYGPIVGSNTGWAEPVIDDWATRPGLVFDPANEWWLRTRRLLDAAAQRAPGRYYVGVPDLNGPGEILALLRGTERLAVDLIEHPDAVKVALKEVEAAWLRYWEAAIGTIHQYIGGYLHWMGLWSDLPSSDLQNDLSCMTSPQMFEEFFIPGLERQTRWVARTVYHLDGPGAVRHLDALLALPEMDAIQWVPGAGKPPMSRWIRLLRRIQAHGKLLVLDCEPWEVELLLADLEPEGLLLKTRCATEEEARRLLSKVGSWTARRTWVAG